MNAVDEANRTCEARVEEHMKDRIDTLRDLWASYLEDPDAYHPEHETNMNEYGLSFDYVAPGTFEGQKEGYFRYQLSWGGPGDEFRIFAQPVNDWQFSVYRIEYWFLDWFDGAKRELAGDDLALLTDIFTSFFVDSGSANHEYEKSVYDTD